MLTIRAWLRSPYRGIYSKEMKAVAAKLTTKGQITIPREVRERLGLRAGDHVVFRLDDAGTAAELGSVGNAHQATMVPVPDLLSLAGSMRPGTGRRRQSWAAIRAAAWDQELAARQ